MDRAVERTLHLEHGVELVLADQRHDRDARLGSVDVDLARHRHPVAVALFDGLPQAMPSGAFFPVQSGNESSSEKDTGFSSSVKTTYVAYVFAMARSRRPSPQTAAVLAALAERPARWRHGYDLAKETGLASGTLYPILMRLERRGALEARWQQPERPGRPARHMYRLTGEGRRLAHEAAPAERPRLSEATA